MQWLSERTPRGGCGRTAHDGHTLVAARRCTAPPTASAFLQDRFRIPNPGFVYDFQFVDVLPLRGPGESAPSPYFYQNFDEAEYVVRVFMYMRLLGYPASKISILTTYNGQKALLEDVVRRHCAAYPAFGEPAKIATVDKFQGQQNDYVLLSLVRTKRVGHLRDVRRLVVAMSRARLGLYVFGCRPLFEQCLELAPTFRRLLERPTALALMVRERWGVPGGITRSGEGGGAEAAEGGVVVQNLLQMEEVVQGVADRTAAEVALAAQAAQHAAQCAAQQATSGQGAPQSGTVDEGAGAAERAGDAAAAVGASPGMLQTGAADDAGASAASATTMATPPAQMAGVGPLPHGVLPVGGPPLVMVPGVLPPGALPVAAFPGALPPGMMPGPGMAPGPGVMPGPVVMPSGMTGAFPAPVVLPQFAVQANVGAPQGAVMSGVPLKGKRGGGRHGGGRHGGARHGGREGSGGGNKSTEPSSQG